MSPPKKGFAARTPGPLKSEGVGLVEQKTDAMKFSVLLLILLLPLSCAEAPEPAPSNTPKALRSPIYIPVKKINPAEMEARLGILMGTDVIVKAQRKPKPRVKVVARPDQYDQARELAARFDKKHNDGYETESYISTREVPTIVVLKSLVRRYPGSNFMPSRRRADTAFVRTTDAWELKRIKADVQELDRKPSKAKSLDSGAPLGEPFEMTVFYAPKKALAEHYFNIRYPEAKIRTDYAKGKVTISGLSQGRTEALAAEFKVLEDLAHKLAKRR